MSKRAYYLVMHEEGSGRSANSAMRKWVDEMEAKILLEPNFATVTIPNKGSFTITGRKLFEFTADPEKTVLFIICDVKKKKE